MTWSLSNPSTFLSSNGMDYADKKYLAQFGVMDDTFDQVAPFLDRVFPFLSKKMEKDDAYSLFKAVNDIHPLNKISFNLIERVFPLLTPSMNKGDAYSLFNVVAKINTNDVASVLANASRLFTAETGAQEKIEIIETVQQILWADRPGVTEQVARMVTPNMKASGIAALLRTVNHIDRDNRLKVIERALPLFTPEMDGIGRSYILKAVDFIGDEISQVADLAETLIHARRTGESRAIILKAVFAVEKEDQADVVGIVGALISDNMDGPQVANLIEVVAKIHKDDRDNVFMQSIELMNDEMTGYDKANVLQVVHAFDRAQRKEVIAYAKELYPCSMTGASDRLAVARAIYRMEQKNRSHAVEWTKKLMPPVINSSGIIDFLQLTSQITDEKVISWTISFFPEALKSVSDRMMLLRTVHQISQKDNWEDILSKASQQITDEMNAAEVNKILLGQGVATPSHEDFDIKMLIEKAKWLAI